MMKYDKIKLANVARKYGLRFVILYGSYATGRIHKGSDLDIAVLGSKELGGREYLNLHGEVADIFGDNSRRELDLKMLNRVDSFFRYQVVRDGVLLYGDATEYKEFKLFAQRAYDDARPLLELERALSEKYQKYLNTFTARYA
ncbi:nucleotidyltransferase domain-containing protein [Candidatus Uhrbacteria bacterium]|nr:nucleotidyltransferase domain-containing protein [Candidatus Uhrbacteria bacterium]